MTTKGPRESKPNLLSPKSKNKASLRDIWEIRITKSAFKELAKVPRHIKDNFEDWVNSVKDVGLFETRKAKGYHDEPLKPPREGQRSVRLSKSWRAFYCIQDDDKLQFIRVEEVNNHDY